MTFMKLLTILFLIFSTYANANVIALTFDDAPREDGNLFIGSERAQKIIDTLAKHQIQAAFFVNPERFKHEVDFPKKNRQI
ncbi:MAG: polysaccharide deacetylase family protein [Bdellovibrionaceae bacterium]|nr:polysaccharide deacetylase family protein [Pseudobdellovibrionaceae bacterium]